MDAHQINPQKEGKAKAAFALAVTPPEPETMPAGRGGRRGGGRGGRSLSFLQDAAAATVTSFKPAGRASF